MHLDLHTTSDVTPKRLERTTGRSRRPMITLLIAMVSAALVLGGAAAAAADETPPAPATGVIHVTADDVTAINEQLSAEGGAARVPATTTSLVADAGSVTPVDAQGQPLAVAAGWGDVWAIAKCTAAIGGFIAGNALLLTKVKKLGGVAKVVKKLRDAKNKEARLKAAVAFFGDISGVGGVVSACS